MINQVKKSKKVVEIINLKKSFGNQVILQDISLSLMEGENLVILGKSGSGKSVLIKCLIGLLTTDSGQINVFEENMNTSTVKELALLREKIGFLFQSSALYDSMTVRQNLEFPLRRIKKNLTENQIEEKVKEVLENVGLVDSIDKMPSELSGGMRKRISLARTLVIDPKIMLYDEPTTGLDPVTSDEISALILDVQKKYKTSSIIITHDVDCARVISNRMILLVDGINYAEGTFQELTAMKDEKVSAFFK